MELCVCKSVRLLVAFVAVFFVFSDSFCALAAGKEEALPKEIEVKEHAELANIGQREGVLGRLDKMINRALNSLKRWDAGQERLTDGQVVRLLSKVEFWILSVNPKEGVLGSNALVMGEGLAKEDIKTLLTKIKNKLPKDDSVD